MFIADVLAVQNFSTYSISAELDNSYRLTNMKMKTSFKGIVDNYYFNSTPK